MIFSSYFRQMAEEDCDVVVMEASSQGFKLDRTAGILFDYGLFARTFLPIISDRMNIRILRNIFLARQSCFNSVNMDMRILMMSILQRLRRMPLARSDDIFGLNEKADLAAYDVALTRDRDFLGVDFDLKGTYEGRISCGVPGTFNVHNALGAICIAGHMGVTVEQMNKALRHFSVKGRVQIVPTGYDPTLIN